MSLAMTKMWISFFAMALMFISMVFIYISRYKIKRKIVKVITAFIAYSLMIYSGIIIFLIVISGPTMNG